MNSASSPWETNDERWVRVGRRGQSVGRGTAVDGAKRPATGDISRILMMRVFQQRHVVIAIGTGEGSRREGSAPARAR